MMDPLFGDFSEEDEYYDQGPPQVHGIGRPRRQLPQVHKQSFLYWFKVSFSYKGRGLTRCHFLKYNRYCI